MSCTRACSMGVSDPKWSSSAGPIALASAPRSCVAAALASAPPLVSLATLRAAGTTYLMTSCGLLGNRAWTMPSSFSANSGFARELPWREMQWLKFCGGKRGGGWG